MPTARIRNRSGDVGRFLSLGIRVSLSKDDTILQNWEGAELNLSCMSIDTESRLFFCLGYTLSTLVGDFPLFSLDVDLLL